MNDNKRIIEVALPVEEVSEQGRGKNQIAGIHKWWARRPLGPSRATAYAALVDNPVNKLSQNRNLTDDDNTASFPPKHNFIAELSKWENALKPLWIQQAKEDILESHGGNPPKVLDPFGGRGAIPLEAQRLGCETYSSDLNPVAVLIQKCTLEYPQKYGQRLHDDVKKWGDRILTQVTEELADFYSKEPDDSDIFAYIWARTLPCQNFSCDAVIPLMSQFWLAKNKKIAIFPYNKDGQVAFRIVGPGHAPMPNNFDPSKGTVKDAIVTCPLPNCRHTIPAKETRQLFQSGEASERMVAIATKHLIKGKQYHIATNEDMDVFNTAQRKLSEKQESLAMEWGFNPVPDEKMPSAKVVRVSNYLNTYGALFNRRQQLFLITFTEKVRDAYSEMLTHGYEPDYARALSAYLGLWLDSIAAQSATLCRWRNDNESVVEMFGMQTIPMIWDYGEANPLDVAVNRLKSLLRPTTHLCQMNAEPVTIKRASATKLPYPENNFDAVLTDPPYYDNVAYAYLSDFFYVWLKRSIGKLFPEFFETNLTPKDEEIVAYSHREGGKQAGKMFFETELSKAFKEMHRVLKPNGIAVIVYAHKSTEGWETLINALLDSGLVITGAWPIDTEMKSRMRALDSATLTSSIYMVARKRERGAVGIYQEVRQELETHLSKQLFTLWEYGFSGADLFIAAIGLGIEVFGKYETVLDDDDNIIRADRMIADIREILERFDSDQTGIAGTHLTRFYLRWRREYGVKSVLFNDARELALSLGIELTKEWKAGSFIQQERTNVRVLGPQEREQTNLSRSEELIDVLHHALLLWRSGNRAEMIQRLSKDSIGLNELIWNIAQQISKALPTDNQERQWLEGWLADRDTIQREIQNLLETSKERTLL